MPEPNKPLLTPSSMGPAPPYEHVAGLNSKTGRGTGIDFGIAPVPSPADIAARNAAANIRAGYLPFGTRIIFPPPPPPFVDPHAHIPYALPAVTPEYSASLQLRQHTISNMFHGDLPPGATVPLGVIGNPSHVEIGPLTGQGTPAFQAQERLILGTGQPGRATNLIRPNATQLEIELGELHPTLNPEPVPQGTRIRVARPTFTPGQIGPLTPAYLLIDAALSPTAQRSYAGAIPDSAGHLPLSSTARVDPASKYAGLPRQQQQAAIARDYAAYYTQYEARVQAQLDAYDYQQKIPPAIARVQQALDVLQQPRAAATVPAPAPQAAQTIPRPTGPFFARPDTQPERFAAPVQPLTVPSSGRAAQAVQPTAIELAHAVLDQLRNASTIPDQQAALRAAAAIIHDLNHLNNARNRMIGMLDWTDP